MVPLDPSILQIKDLQKYFPVKQHFLRSLMGRTEPLYIKAVDGVSFAVNEGETLGLAGESGSGKTTTGKLIGHLLPATAGMIRFQGQEAIALKGGERKRFHRQVQMVFQDPYTSQNPRFTVLQWVQEPLIIHGLGNAQWRRHQIMETLERAGLKPASHYIDSFPHELSGGQRQRLAIARALVLEPKCLIADEPTSMLDVSLRAGLIKLIRSLTVERGLATIYISHDLSLMRHICDRIAIMYLGKIVEVGPTEHILKTPRHPYAKALIAAVPIPNPRVKRSRTPIAGEATFSHELIPGCRFQPRCPIAEDRCRLEPPGLEEVATGHRVACWKA